MRLPDDLASLFADGGIGRTLSAPPPPGSVVWPDPGYHQHQPAKCPAFWLSDEPVTAADWARFQAEHPASGLWPVLLDDSAQPWSDGQVAPEPCEEIDEYDPAEFMAEVWTDWRKVCDGRFGELEPFGPSCPGLAAGAEPFDDPAAVAVGTVADLTVADLAPGALLGLVAAERSADTLTVMGWQGVINHNPWTAPLSAVIRSWEERFGARVVRVGFNTLDLSVAAPPVTEPHALGVAAEHWAFCPDTVVFQGPGTLADYAEQILSATMWSFWWD
jgi:Domain of unknown function (DUF4253)